MQNFWTNSVALHLFPDWKDLSSMQYIGEIDLKGEMQGDQSLVFQKAWQVFWNSWWFNFHFERCLSSRDSKSAIVFITQVLCCKSDPRERPHSQISLLLSLINFWFFVPPIFKTYLKSVLAIWKCTDFTCLSFVKTSRAGFTANNSRIFICELHSWTEQVPLVVCRWQTALQPVIETYVWIIICGGKCIRHFCSLDLTIIW